MGVHSFEAMLISRYFLRQAISNYFQQPEACLEQNMCMWQQRQVRCQPRTLLRGNDSCGAGTNRVIKHGQNLGIFLL